MPTFPISRRLFTQGVAVTLAGASTISLAASPVPDGKPLRIALPSPGTAGAVWKPLIEGMRDRVPAGLPPIEWVVSDPGRMQVQLMAGSLDVGFFGPIGLAGLRARGSDIVLFGPGTTNHSVWLVKGDSRFRKPQDLVGRRIATQPETSETYQQARIAASLAGLDLKKDFEVMLGSPLANLALFERGDVDAVIILEPTASRLVAAGAREIGRVGGMWQDATGDREDPYLIGLAAQREWLDQNPQTAQGLARLFADANARVIARPAILQEVHAHIGLKESERDAIALLPQRMKATYSSQWNATVWRGIDRQIDLAVKAGILAQRPTRPVYNGIALA